MKKICRKEIAINSCVFRNLTRHFICNGVVLEIYLDHKFQRPHEVSNVESLAYKVVT